MVMKLVKKICALVRKVQLPTFENQNNSLTCPLSMRQVLIFNDGYNLQSRIYREKQ